MPCSHTYSDGRTAATGPHDNHLKCALCRVRMVWSTALGRYVEAPR